MICPSMLIGQCYIDKLNKIDKLKEVEKLNNVNMLNNINILNAVNKLKTINIQLNVKLNTKHNDILSYEDSKQRLFQ